MFVVHYLESTNTLSSYLLRTLRHFQCYQEMQSEVELGSFQKDKIVVIAGKKEYRHLLFIHRTHSKRTLQMFSQAL